MQRLQPIIQIRSLKEEVYNYLREQLRTGGLSPGSEISLEETSRKLGVSRTPLRDALLQLEGEGFVTIYPRRGIIVNTLSRKDIRNFYEIIGSLESTALALAAPRIAEAEIRRMEDLIEEMTSSIAAADFDHYYEKNLHFHDVYLNLCANENLVRIVRTLKKRLYDFPRKKGFVKDWELASIEEHRELLRLLKEKRAADAAAFVRDVHWSPFVQAQFIERYYGEAPESQKNSGK